MVVGDDDKARVVEVAGERPAAAVSDVPGDLPRASRSPRPPRTATAVGRDGVHAAPGCGHGTGRGRRQQLAQRARPRRAPWSFRPSGEVAVEPGRPPDPNLHSHAFLFNLAHCQGRFLAVDSRPLYAFATTAQAVYACELAAQLQRLGHRLAWRQTRAGWAWELAGVDHQVVELFSSRHGQIEQQAAQFQAARGRPPTLRGAASSPPLAAPPRLMPAARRTGPPTTPSSAATACTRPGWRGTGAPGDGDAAGGAGGGGPGAAARPRGAHPSGCDLRRGAPRQGDLPDRRRVAGRFGGARVPGAVCGGPDLVSVATPGARSSPPRCCWSRNGGSCRLPPQRRARACWRHGPTCWRGWWSVPRVRGRGCRPSSGPRWRGWRGRSGERRWRAWPAPARPPCSAPSSPPTAPTASRSWWSRRRRRPPGGPPASWAFRAAGLSRRSVAPSSMVSSARGTTG